MTSMPKMLGVTAIAAAGLMMTPGQADALTLGTMEGTIGVRMDPYPGGGYTINGVRTGANLFGPEFTNIITLNPAISPIFEDQPKQFALELDWNRDGTKNVDPVDYNGSVGVPTGTPVTWALTGNFNDGSRENSVFRGDDATINFNWSGDINFVEISGLLVNDGVIHWYTPGTPHTSITGDFRQFAYHGTFSLLLDSSNNPLMVDDYYLFHTSDLTFSVIPTPAAAAAGLIGFGVLGLRRRQTEDTAV